MPALKLIVILAEEEKHLLVRTTQLERPRLSEWFGERKDDLSGTPEKAGSQLWHATLAISSRSVVSLQLTTHNEAALGTLLSLFKC